MANYVKPVVFLLGKEMYGVDINLVQSIEKDLNVVPVPNSQSYIKGIVNMRNEVIPVYSLARKFGKEQEATAESTIIISSGGLKLALEVDEVLEINDIDESHILPMPSMLVKADTQYLDRVANVDGKLILLLDVEKLLSDDEAEDVKNYRRTAERVKLKLLQGDMEVAMMKNETKKQTFDRSAGF